MTIANGVMIVFTLLILGTAIGITVYGVYMFGSRSEKIIAVIAAVLFVLMLLEHVIT